MSDSPTKNFKGFIGWAFAGMAGVVLSLVTMIYSSLSADVQRVDREQQQHAQRIKGAEDHLESQRESLQRIDKGVHELNKKIDDWNLRYK